MFIILLQEGSMVYGKLIMIMGRKLGGRNLGIWRMLGILCWSLRI